MKPRAPARNLRERQAALFRGQWSEWLAEAWLRAKLYRILARRYRVRDGEIDLIARRGALVLFVEVKARPTLKGGLEAISAAKTRRMARAARHWMARNPALSGCSFRADAIVVTPWRLPRHVHGVAELDLG